MCSTPVIISKNTPWSFINNNYGFVSKTTNLVDIQKTLKSALSIDENVYNSFFINIKKLIPILNSEKFIKSLDYIFNSK